MPVISSARTENDRLFSTSDIRITFKTRGHVSCIPFCTWWEAYHAFLALFCKCCSIRSLPDSIRKQRRPLKTAVSSVFCWALYHAFHKIRYLKGLKYVILLFIWASVWAALCSYSETLDVLVLTTTSRKNFCCWSARTCLTIHAVWWIRGNILLFWRVG